MPSQKEAMSTQDKAKGDADEGGGDPSMGCVNAPQAVMRMKAQTQRLMGQVKQNKSNTGKVNKMRKKVVESGVQFSLVCG